MARKDSGKPQRVSEGSRRVSVKPRRVSGPGARRSGLGIRHLGLGVRLFRPDGRLSRQGGRVSRPGIRLSGPGIRVSRPDVNVSRPDGRLEGPGGRPAFPSRRGEFHPPNRSFYGMGIRLARAGGFYGKQGRSLDFQWHGADGRRNGQGGPATRRQGERSTGSRRSSTTGDAKAIWRFILSNIPFAIFPRMKDE